MAYSIPINQSEEELVKIQTRGLLTIPKKYRQELDLNENQIARLIKEKGRLIIEPVRTLPYPVRSYAKKELREFVELDEKDSQELRKAKLI